MLPLPRENNFAGHTSPCECFLLGLKGILEGLQLLQNNLQNALEKNLVDVSDIFYFFCSGEGKGEPPRRREAGGRFFIENPRRGGGSRVGGGGGARGREGVCRELGGWGLNIFFRGRKARQEKLTWAGQTSPYNIPKTW